MIAAAAALAALVVVGITYRRQIWSRLTHWTGPPATTYTLEPFPVGGEPLFRIAVAGDAGDSGGSQARIGGSMAAAAAIGGPYDVLLLLGDNVYPDGDPGLLGSAVWAPFDPVLDSGAALYAIAGNHDALQPDGGARQLALLGMDGLWWSADLGEVLVVGLDSNQIDDPNQLAWLNDTLGEAGDRWLIVAMHHPPYSGGYQGSDLATREALMPILARHQVDLVLSGHDHDYQRIGPLDGVTYVVSGAGGGYRRTGRISETAYATATQSYLEIDVFADRLLLCGIDADTRLFDEAAIAR